jgi:hypothetical protein
MGATGSGRARAIPGFETVVSRSLGLELPGFEAGRTVNQGVIHRDAGPGNPGNVADSPANQDHNC